MTDGRVQPEEFTLTVAELVGWLSEQPQHARVMLNANGTVAQAVGHVLSADGDWVIVTGGG